MKLKKALRIAKRNGYNWVAVDADKRVWAYMKLPTSYVSTWGAVSCNFIDIGVYTGSIAWAKTLREVK